MSEWRHTFEVPACDWTGDTDAEYPVCSAADGDLGCGHTKVEPDPASPCGFEGCIDPDGPGYRQRLPHYVHPAGHDKHAPIASCHPHQPTRCTCGHNLERVES